MRRCYLLVTDGAEASCLVIFFTVNIRRVVELPVPPEQGPPPFLVLEVPVKTCEGSVLLTLVLQEQGALLHSELLQVPEIQRNCYRDSSFVITSRWMMQTI